MDINAANAAAGTAKVDSAATGRARLAESFDTFLSLLTTQLKNQDPLSPMDSNQFTQQIVQMTGVEQQLLTNDLLKKLVGNTGNGVATAVSLIGKDVRATSDTTAISGGKAEWIYKLDRAATDVKLEVIDSAGRVVHVVAPTGNGAGDHALSWNGRDQSGAQLPNGGVYTLRISAKDGSGATVPATAYVQGRVTGVEQAAGQTLITINGGQVSWEKVTTIREPINPGGQTSSPAAA